MDLSKNPHSSPKLQDGIYYIVLADLIGSTSYMEKWGNDAGIARFREFESAAAQALDHARSASPDHSGRIVKTVGDAVLLAFSHFPDIVQWHLEFDGVLFCTPTKTEPKKAKIWVHVGELRFEGDDFNGLGVSQLFKIEKKAKEKAQPGSFTVSHLAKEIAESALYPEHCALEACGTVKLEAHSPIRLYRLTKADLPFLFSKQIKGRFQKSDA